MKLIAVVAATENNVIGIGDKMPWHLPDDFKFFKETTLGKPVLMGKNTWLTLGKALKGRENVVISRSLEEAKDAKIFRSVNKAIEYFNDSSENTVFVIGGGEIYKQMFDVLDEIFMTRIHTKLEGGKAFFPEISEEVWQLTWNKYHPKDENHEYDFTFQHWVRK